MYPEKEYEELIKKIKTKVKEELNKNSKANVSGLNLDTAKRLADAAVKKAGEMGVNVAVAVMDIHGNMILFNRMDDSVLAAIEVAPKKAYTSAALRIPSSEVLKGGFDKLVETMEGKIAAFGGGLPVRSNGIFLGALGVSGGTSEEDIKIAEYAVNAVFG
ncbi:Domain of uncharacterised function (DUF336) [Sebaldella termitidis]|uniref:ATP:cob(I)alamin adenosyltransferase n=1 Tax=Sebaldella termitidis (strain ATCC 33386 / NCTC 11300) TaxID=526218 RepID=D1AFL9_SEBTE|nr:heme-binding protein [Sebaldella termitidis]ACZ07904.1 protein of unknown function DUF336 [Sebaldella termitidis ATCC 33386]SUI23205.1 Domain of uncharacterised function (DUF336) [Sebaldella termitidis]